mgnify:FL=1
MIINNLSELKQVVKNLDCNKKIGAISGSFDCLHEGHKYSLDYCSKKVDILFVLINSDQSIKTYKGNSRPIQNLNQRLNSLEEFSENLYFISFDELIPNKTLEIIKPNVYFLSSEWIINPVEMPLLSEIDCEIMEHPELDGVSTSKNIRDIDTSKGAIFLDRDGTINEDVGYLNSIEDIVISEGNLVALRKISQFNLFNIIITNQSGVGYGYFTLQEMNKINNEILKIINLNGGRIDKIYCDTSTKENPSVLRKPNIGMVLKAREEFNISLKKSWVIGDKDSDIELGKKCNMRTIYIQNNQYEYRSLFRPDYKVQNLNEAYEIINI